MCSVVAPAFGIDSEKGGKNREKKRTSNEWHVISPVPITIDLVQILISTAAIVGWAVINCLQQTDVRHTRACLQQLLGQQSYGKFDYLSRGTANVYFREYMF